MFYLSNSLGLNSSHQGLKQEIEDTAYRFVSTNRGSVSAEHGIGQMKVADLHRLGDPVALSMMRRVKDALDPQGLLNPGKLVPAIQS